MKHEKKTKPKSISAEELDRKFDEGKEDILQYFDLSRAHQPGREQKRLNVDVPIWLANAMDSEAKRLGITRQSLIKVWLVKYAEQQTSEST